MAPVAQPAVELLNGMYCGRAIIERLYNLYGDNPATWHNQVLQSVLRRHTLLQQAVIDKICGVPRDMFMPLGHRARKVIAAGQAY